MSDEKPIILIRIRDLRRERALTQEELAAELGLSRQSINAMEAGRCLPSLPVALQIASFFSVPLATVFEFPEFSEAIQQVGPPQEEKNTTSLLPWSPLREMREALDELMDESTNRQVQPSVGVPAANIIELGSHLKIELFLPGFKKDDLSIEVGEDFVTVAGEVTRELENDSSQYYRREYTPQSFQRSISLPAIVESEQAEAEMKQGVLTIILPKVVEEKPKTAKISIKSGE